MKVCRSRWNMGYREYILVHSKIIFYLLQDGCIPTQPNTTVGFLQDRVLMSHAPNRRSVQAFQICSKESCTNMGGSKRQEPKYRPQSRRALIIRTPKKLISNVQEQPYLLQILTTVLVGGRQNRLVRNGHHPQ